MTLYICLLSTILLAVGTNNLLNQLGLPDELSAGFSISLSLAGFMQMAVGMRLHLKVVRMISLATFSIVLLKVGVGRSVALAYDRESGRLYNLGSYLIGSLLLVSEVENRLVR